VTIFDFRDYKTYLKKLAADRGQRSGFKSSLAKACRCNNAYISGVLGGAAHLSLEQAERAGVFLSLSPEELHYLLLLVQRSRAGTQALEKYFDQQLERILEQRLNVQKRLGAKERLSKEDQAQYYISWIYAAVHVALSVPRLQTPEALARYLDVPLAAIRKILDFLEGTGLAKRNGSLYAIGPRHIHLGKESENVQRHHVNWRLRAIRALEADADRGLNYSSAVALSRDDAFKVREILLSAVKNSVDLIMKSPEEEVFTLAVDFLPLGKPGA
jgi:uncharacterized protein (TIGR02147 family)